MLSLTMMGEMTIPVPSSRAPSGNKEVSTRTLPSICCIPCSHLFSQLAEHNQRIPRHGARIETASVTMILILKGQRPIGLNALRKVRIAARHQHQIAMKRAISIDGPGSIDPRVKTIIRTEQFERCSFGQ